MSKISRMRFFTTLLFSGLFLLTAQAQLTQSADAWRADLRFLQTTVHDDYDFLFRKVEQATWDEEVEKLYQAIPELADHEVIVGLARIVALFQYGHTGIYTGGWYADDPLGFHQLPYQLYHFSDGLYVQGVHQDYAEALGARVVAIAGKPVEEVLAAVVFVLGVAVFRGLYDAVPFLFALGIAAALGGLAVIGVRLIRRPDAWLGPIRLKVDGRYRRPGRVTTDPDAGVHHGPTGPAERCGGHHDGPVRDAGRGTPGLATPHRTADLGRRGGPEDASPDRGGRRRHDPTDNER